MSRRLNRRETNIDSVSDIYIEKDPLKIILGESYNFYMEYLKDCNLIILGIMKEKGEYSRHIKFVNYEKHASLFLKALLLGDEGNSEVLTNFINALAMAKYNNNLELAFSGTVKFIYSKFYQ